MAVLYGTTSSVMDKRSIASSFPGSTARMTGPTEAPLVASRVFCANCIHCKIVPAPSDIAGRFKLRVRCDAGKWKKKLGEEKIYKYFTVANRSIPSCAAYEDMGDTEEFLRDLRKELPTCDEDY